MAKVNRAALSVLVVLFFAAFAAAQSYTVTDLGPGVAYAINSLGDVVEQNIYNRAFVWKPGGHLHALAGLTGDLGTVPNGINSQDLAVGLSINGQGSFALLWTNDKPLNLGTLPGGTESAAAGINASGEVVGWSGIPTGAEAFLWTEATGMQGLGFLPGAKFSVAKAINRFGQVAGYSGATFDNIRKDYAFIWSTTTGMKNLGKLPGYDSSAAYAINDLGQVAGTSYCKSSLVCPAHAVLWGKTKGSMLDLGVLPGASSSTAAGINNVGQVVGLSDNRAFVWSPSTGMLDLNSLIPANSGWVLIGATAINDQGEIVGYGTVNCCVIDAFVLTPQ